jgi:hypothetical protein
MPDNQLTVLVLGDVIGQSGCRAVLTSIAKLQKSHNADITIVNGENAVDGFGITPEVASRFLSAGADVITSGNHIWQKQEVFEYLDQEQRLLRPANYPGGNPGHGVYVVESKGFKVAVINLQGRDRMYPIDCPFRKSKEILRKLPADLDARIVDFHAESVDEKEALGVHLDGHVSALYGTHTHVQTADERILESGTAYISDIGACGPRDSVIGFKADLSMERARTQLPIRNEVSNNPATIHGISLRIDRATGRTQAISRIREESLV